MSEVADLLRGVVQLRKEVESGSGSVCNEEHGDVEIVVEVETDSAAEVEADSAAEVEADGICLPDLREAEVH